MHLFSMTWNATISYFDFIPQHTKVSFKGTSPQLLWLHIFKVSWIRGHSTLLLFFPFHFQCQFITFQKFNNTPVCGLQLSVCTTWFNIWHWLKQSGSLKIFVIVLISEYLLMVSSERHSLLLKYFNSFKLKSGIPDIRRMYNIHRRSIKLYWIDQCM